MITKSDIIKAAHEQGFEDVGFTTADPFPDHKQLLLDRRDGMMEMGSPIKGRVNRKNTSPEGKI